MRYVIVDDQTDVVVNSIEWDGQSDWTPGEGLSVHLSDAHIGWLWKGGSPIDPNPGSDQQDVEANSRATQMATAIALSESTDLKDRIDGIEIRLRLLGG